MEIGAATITECRYIREQRFQKKQMFVLQDILVKILHLQYTNFGSS